MNVCYQMTAGKMIQIKEPSFSRQLWIYFLQKVNLVLLERAASSSPFLSVYLLIIWQGNQIVFATMFKVGQFTKCHWKPSSFSLLAFDVVYLKFYNSHRIGKVLKNYFFPQQLLNWQKILHFPDISIYEQLLKHS